MSQKTNPAKGTRQHDGAKENKVKASANEDAVEEIEISKDKTMYDHITLVMEKFATTRIGQKMIEKTDYLLKVVENTAKWSLPQSDTDLQLERPLPWIFFLMLIVWLRALRIWSSVISYLVGSQPVTPYTVVYYIQKKRRRLRAIRVQGLKSKRQQEVDTTVKYNPFMDKLRAIFGSAICKPGQNRDEPIKRITTSDGQGDIHKETEKCSKRFYDDDKFDQNLTLNEMLEKYANEDSDNDSDFVPNEDENTESSTSYTSSLSDDDTEKETEENITKTIEESKPSNVNTITSKVHNAKPVKENGETTGLKPNNNSTKEHVHFLKDNADKVSEQNTQNSETEKPVAGTEVAQQNFQTTPKMKNNNLTVSQLELSKQKPTPGHESAASLKPSSATGSPKDFHPIFHPAPIVNSSNTEDFAFSAFLDSERKSSSR